MNKISRRGFLRLTSKTTMALVIGKLLELIPEAQPVFASSESNSTWSSPPPNDPRYKKTLAAVKSTPEYTQFKETFAKKDPADYWLDTGSGNNFMSFVIQEPALSDPEAFRKSPVYLLQTLIFAVDGEYDPIDVYLTTPNPQSLTETSNLNSLMESLREGTQQEIVHSEPVSAEIRKLYQTSTNSKAIAKASVQDLPGEIVPLGCGPYCDCGSTRMYYCSHQTCGGGYVDNNCYFTCSLACVFPSNPVAKAACLVACRGACWVPRYCYCDTYLCRSCAC